MLVELREKEGGMSTKYGRGIFGGVPSCVRSSASTLSHFTSWWRLLVLKWVVLVLVSAAVVCFRKRLLQRAKPAVLSQWASFVIRVENTSWEVLSRNRPQGRGPWLMSKHTFCPPPIEFEPPQLVLDRMEVKVWSHSKHLQAPPTLTMFHRDYVMRAAYLFCYLLCYTFFLLYNMVFLHSCVILLLNKDILLEFY